VRGSHRIYRHADGRRVVVAYHSLSDTFPIGTLRAMIEDAGWQDEDLRRLGLLG
jgi:predicted RNA binding protein YcfA (HicA-like mRNA interferase family)